MKDDIKVWIQFFFDDGTVSEGKRIPAYFLDEGYESFLDTVTISMIRQLNRVKGYRLIWGAGNVQFRSISLCEGLESETWVLES